MSELEELYQSVLLEHAENPRNFGACADCDRKVSGYNPVCGDKVEVCIKLQGDIISHISFNGVGCAISLASASLMTELVEGKTTAQCEALFSLFREWMIDGRRAEEIASLGELASLSGVRRFPIRVKCATLAWHALNCALHAEGSTSIIAKEIITTE